jgi:D-arabinose 1-dehydrogenase-like Zn-dependent alcohol dehydrogenase
MSSKMKAAVVRRFAEALVNEEVPVPVPGESQIDPRVNRGDVRLRIVQNL